MPILMALGPFRFEMAKSAHEVLSRKTRARWPVQERIGRPVALQFTGPGEDRVSLEGTLFAELGGGIAQIEDMRAASAEGSPLMLVSGLGRVFGRFCITEVKTKGSYLDRHGEPRKLEFDLDLIAYGEDGKGAGGGALRLLR